LEKEEIFMKTAKQPQANLRTKNPAAGGRARVEFHILRELAAATTAYHEAPPDRLEQARVVYQEVLQRFNLAQSTEVPRTFTAGAGSMLDACE
jgi:hypothetical protein